MDGARGARGIRPICEFGAGGVRSVGCRRQYIDKQRIGSMTIAASLRSALTRNLIMAVPDHARDVAFQKDSDTASPERRIGRRKS